MKEDDIIKPIILAVLDGFGYREEEKGNALVKETFPLLKDLFLFVTRCE